MVRNGMFCSLLYYCNFNFKFMLFHLTIKNQNNRILFESNSEISEDYSIDEKFDTVNKIFKETLEIELSDNEYFFTANNCKIISLIQTQTSLPSVLLKDINDFLPEQVIITIQTEDNRSLLDVTEDSTENTTSNEDEDGENYDHNNSF